MILIVELVSFHPNECENKIGSERQMLLVDNKSRKQFFLQAIINDTVYWVVMTHMSSRNEQVVSCIWHGMKQQSDLIKTK